MRGGSSQTIPMPPLLHTKFRISHPELRLEIVEIRPTTEEYLSKAKETTTELEGIGRAASK
jgi:hypothetical protein